MTKVLPHTALRIAVIAWMAFIPAVRAATLSTSTTLDSTHSSSSETSLGDLVADAIKASSPQADFAFVPALEIRTITIAPGPVQNDQILGAVRDSQDLADTVMLLTLTGQQIRQVLERSVSRLPSSYSGFLQVSGLKFTYDVSQPVGSRIVSLEHSDGSAINDTQKFVVATTHLLGDGGIGYFEVFGLSPALKDSSIPVSDAVDNFLATKQVLDYQTAGRINSQ